MSWLFGWKKNQKGYPSEAGEDGKPSDESDEYIIIEKKLAPQPPQPGQSGPGYPTGSMYPYIPPVSEFSSMTVDPAASQGESTRFLNDIPFKLCKRLEILKNNDFEIDRLRIGEILSFIERIESSDYSYSFSLEEDVKAEMNNLSDQ
ncbi:uncharacterized protein LOC143214410 [Lasioglossum baleicum]|uniref:uncharacterized protein LOC143214410 n=1 Tax=Lasioglossum baleicum TaxID=434251 RepID=UPI003FCD44C2